MLFAGRSVSSAHICKDRQPTSGDEQLPILKLARLKLEVIDCTTLSTGRPFSGSLLLLLSSRLVRLVLLVHSRNTANGRPYALCQPFTLS
jgi:hypothetical protein